MTDDQKTHESQTPCSPAQQLALQLTLVLDQLSDEALIALQDAIDQTRLARLSETFHA